MCNSTKGGSWAQALSNNFIFPAHTTSSFPRISTPLFSSLKTRDLEINTLRISNFFSSQFSNQSRSLSQKKKKEALSLPVNFRTTIRDLSYISQPLQFKMDTSNEIEEASRKRIRSTTMEEKEEEEVGVVEEAEPIVVGSEEMELHINSVLERIDRFTQQVSELLEAGKSHFKELSDEFEDRLITIHKEQIEKWQDEIKEMRLLDASNEEANALLHNARYLLQNVHNDSGRLMQ